MLWFHSAYRVKKTPSFSWFLRLCPICPLFPSLALLHIRVPLAFFLWQNFYGHCSLSLKSSSLTFSPGKSLFLFRPHVNHLIFRETFSIFSPRLSLLYSPSGQHLSLLQTIFHGCNFTYVCTVFFFFLRNICSPTDCKLLEDKGLWLFCVPVWPLHLAHVAECCYKAGIHHPQVSWCNDFPFLTPICHKMAG